MCRHVDLKSSYRTAPCCHGALARVDFASLKISLTLPQKRFFPRSKTLHLRLFVLSILFVPCMGEEGRPGRKEADQLEAILLQQPPLVQLFLLPLKSKGEGMRKACRMHPLR